MQKELKIGLAIGAVLLVVLIVYLAVPKGDGNGRNDVAQGGDTSGETSTEGQEPQGNPSAAPAVPEEPVRPQEPTATGNRQGDSNTQQARGNGGGDDVFGPTTPDEPAGDASAEDVWATLLAKGGDPVTTEAPIKLRADTLVGGEQPAAPEGTGPTTPADPLPPDSQPAGGRETGTPEQPEPAAPETDTGTGTGARTHTIRKGETFAGIAKMVYGAERYYIQIQKANPNVDPARMKPGTVITLPEIDTTGAAAPSSSGSTAGSSTETALDSETEYRVQSGDSLYKIAIKRYGSSSMVDAIYELNRDTIGSDSAKLKVGSVLKMPPKPASDAPAGQ